MTMMKAALLLMTMMWFLTVLSASPCLLVSPFSLFPLASFKDDHLHNCFDDQQDQGDRFDFDSLWRHHDHGHDSWLLNAKISESWKWKSTLIDTGAPTGTSPLSFVTLTPWKMGINGNECKTNLKQRKNLNECKTKKPNLAVISPVRLLCLVPSGCDADLTCQWLLVWWGSWSFDADLICKCR